MRMRSLLLVALLCFIPRRGGAGDFDERGWYVGLAALRAFEDFDTNVTVRNIFRQPISFNVDAGDSWGFDARVGYRFHPHAAAEVQLQYYDEFGLHVSSVFGREILATADGVSTTGNVKWFPFTGRVQPYVAGGLGFLVLRAEDVFGLGVSEAAAAFAGRVAGGLDVYLTEHLALHGEASYLLPAGDLSDFRMIPVTAGAQYRF
jgi:opacity protein-like surface antigen